MTISGKKGANLSTTVEHFAQRLAERAFPADFSEASIKARNRWVRAIAFAGAALLGLAWAAFGLPQEVRITNSGASALATSSCGSRYVASVETLCFDRSLWDRSSNDTRSVVVRSRLGTDRRRVTKIRIVDRAGTLIDQAIL
jgi:hypothetical protein